jgi:hypothetical protein
MQESAWYKNTTFIIAAIVILLFVLWGIFGIASLGVASDWAFGFMTKSLAGRLCSG